MVDVTARQGMLTPLRHLIPPKVYPGVRAYPHLLFTFRIEVMGLITVRYFSPLYVFQNTVAEDNGCSGRL
jgi:hypothetical protein